MIAQVANRIHHRSLATKLVIAFAIAIIACSNERGARADNGGTGLGFKEFHLLDCLDTTPGGGPPGGGGFFLNADSLVQSASNCMVIGTSMTFAINHLNVKNEQDFVVVQKTGDGSLNVAAAITEGVSIKEGSSYRTSVGLWAYAKDRSYAKKLSAFRVKDDGTVLTVGMRVRRSSRAEAGVPNYQWSACRISNPNCAPYQRVEWEAFLTTGSQYSGGSNFHRLTFIVDLPNGTTHFNAPVEKAWHGLSSKDTSVGNDVRVHTYDHRLYFFTDTNPINSCWNTPSDWGACRMSNADWGADPNNVALWSNQGIIETTDAIEVYAPSDHGSPIGDPVWDICMGGVGAPCVIQSPEVAIWSWIDPSRIDLNPAGVNPALQEILTPPIGPVASAACGILLFRWSMGEPFLLFNDTDHQFAGKALLLPADDDPPQFLSDSALTDDRSRRMFSRFQVGVKDGQVVNYVIKEARAGYTHWPCGLEGTFPRLAFGQEHALNNTTMTTSAGVSLIAQSRINREGWPVDATVNKCGTWIPFCPLMPLGFCTGYCTNHLSSSYGGLTPWIWAVIRFDLQTGGLLPPPADLIRSERFNSFSVYIDRQFDRTLLQPADPMPFMLSTNEYQVDPSSIP